MKYSARPSELSYSARHGFQEGTRVGKLVTYLYREMDCKYLEDYVLNSAGINCFAVCGTNDAVDAVELISDQFGVDIVSRHLWEKPQARSPDSVYGYALLYT